MEWIQKFKNLTLTRFLEEIDNNKFNWIVKRLSGNDTGATGGHQVGIYLPKEYIMNAFPEVDTTERLNPDIFFNCYIPNIDDCINGVRAIYYNGKKLGVNSRDEYRITRWGGSSNPLQDIENTGSICIFAISRMFGEPVAVVWVAANIEEEDVIEDWVGEEIEPGRFYFENYDSHYQHSKQDIPEEWKSNFPSGGEIVNYVIKRSPFSRGTLSVDQLLLKRRDIEFKLFEVIERYHVFPDIEKGFKSVHDFIIYANSVTNRRKSRAGRSLELHLEAIFKEEYLEFETQVVTENKKRPDFLFPSGEAYHNSSFLSSQLHMLASKTCCKDRWRQVIDEADRIQKKHLFTLQEGVSSKQLEQMKASNIVLVVPEPSLHSFPVEWQKHILTLSNFIEFIKREQKNCS